MHLRKQVICPERIRQVPVQFSWVDQRLVRDRHLDHLDVVAAALYLFLVTVADVQGLSWYGDASIARRLSIDGATLHRARRDLVQAGLIATALPLYQVLALGEPTLSPPLPSPHIPIGSAAPASTEKRNAERTAIRARIQALHAALRRS